MQTNAGPRRPALPLAFGLFAGIAARGTFELSWLKLVPWFVAGAALLHCARPRPLLPRILIPLLAALLGARAFQDCRDVSLRNTGGWLPDDGSAVQLELEGEVATPPERGFDDERRFRLLARPAAERARAAPARILVKVMPSPPDAVAALDGLQAGDRVRLFANVRAPGSGSRDEIRWRRSLLARGIDAVATVKSARLVRRQTSQPGVRRVLSCAKSAARRRLDRALGPRGPGRELLGAMLLGDRALVSPDRERLLRDGGLVHLLSVSGLHVALAVAALAWLLRRITHAQPLRLALSVPAIAAITMFVNAGAPAERAGITAVVLLCGRALGRDGDSVNTLAMTACLLAFADPPSAFDPSLRLTFSATAGILLLATRIARALPLWRPIALSLGVSVSAYAFSAPICMAEFGSAAPAAVLSNLGGAALCGWVLATGTVAVLFAGVPVLGAASATLASAGAHGLIHLADACSRIPGGSIRVATPSLFMIGACFAALAAAAAGGEAKVRGLAGWLAALVLGAMHLAPLPLSWSDRPSIAATVIDVGQAQAVVVGDPVHGVVLVDAGGSGGGRFDAGDRIVARRLADAGIRRVDVFALTHAHDDHAGGALSILRTVEVGELWLGPGYPRERLASELVALAGERGVAVVLAEDGMRAMRGELSVRVLHPARGDSELTENDRSLVVNVSAGRRGILIPGDIEQRGEARLIARHRESLASEFLVVPHHGGRRSSSPPFVGAVAPQVAVASVGRRNRFGHPDPQVVHRLAERCGTVFRTDLDGDVEIRWGIAGWEVRGEPRTSPAESGSAGE